MKFHVIDTPVNLAARGESTIGRVPSAAGADAKRRDAVDAGQSKQSLDIV